MSLSEILSVLRKRFWLIVAGAFVAGAVAAAFSLLWPPSYQAEALLLITKLRPEVTLDPRFQTAAEENIVNLSIQDDQVRRQTLVGLTQSPDLMQRVVDQLGNDLAPEEQSISYLEGVTDVSTQGNLIVFEVRAATAAKAATIANAWSTVYSDYVNQVYSLTSPSYEQIQVQLVTAQTSYEAAKTAVEDFQRQSLENELGRQIEQKNKLLGDLQTEQLAAARQRVGNLLSRINQTEQLLLDAQALKTQLAAVQAASPLTPGEQFSLFSLESQALAPGAAVSITLQLDGSWLVQEDLTAGQAVAELDRLAQTLEASRAAAQAELTARSATLLTGDELLTSGPNDPAAASIQSLQAEINGLQAELTRYQMQKQDLLDNRSVAKDTYLTLQRKAAEVQILSQLVGVEVQVAAEAKVPEEPAFPRPLLTTALGLFAGGLAGLALAFVAEMWPQEGVGS